ncbi:MAG TPA: response regulator transcription factor [Anaerolineales bacterium]|nr:response regulator transcription factor [Anaerolineales bacterium]
MSAPAPTKLLVFDQDTLGENFLKQMLKPDGFEIIKVSSNTDGLLASRSLKPDVIVINLMQPPANGWKICRKLREFSQVPILVLAAVSDPHIIALWLDAGADDYLTKPFSTEVLVAHLQKLTRRLKIIQNPPQAPLIQ